MKAELKPDGFEVICETPEDWKSLVAHCQCCGRVYRFSPESPLARGVKEAHKMGEDEFVAIPIYGCWKCNKEVKESKYATYLGKFLLTPAELG